MSYHEYVCSQEITAPFYSLIMAAMRQADSVNIVKLRAAFPEVWAELNTRYHALGGLLDGETIPDRERARA